MLHLLKPFARALGSRSADSRAETRASAIAAAVLGDRLIEVRPLRTDGNAPMLLLTVTRETRFREASKLLADLSGSDADPAVRCTQFILVTEAMIDAAPFLRSVRSGEQTCGELSSKPSERDRRLLSVVFGMGRRYLLCMANARKSSDGVDMSLLAGFVDVRPNPGERKLKLKPKRMSGTAEPTHEQRLTGKLARASRREGVTSLTGLSDQEILDRIVG